MSEIRYKSTGEVVDEFAFRAKHENVSFPATIDASTAAQFDADLVLAMPAPVVTGLQIVYRNGVKQDAQGNWVYAWKVVDRTAEELATEAEARAAALVKHYDNVVQTHLDAVARSFGYGDPNRPEVSPILHAISYAEEPAVERFMNEGKALRAWRSLVWVTAAGILNAVKAGEREIPTEDELLAELPPPPTQDPL